MQKMDAFRDKLSKQLFENDDSTENNEDNLFNPKIAKKEVKVPPKSFKRQETNTDKDKTEQNEQPKSETIPDKGSLSSANIIIDNNQNLQQEKEEDNDFNTNPKIASSKQFAQSSGNEKPEVGNISFSEGNCSSVVIDKDSKNDKSETSSLDKNKIENIFIETEKKEEDNM
jgi:hypothetical protein